MKALTWCNLYVEHLQCTDQQASCGSKGMPQPVPAQEQALIASSLFTMMALMASRWERAHTEISVEGRCSQATSQQQARSVRHAG